MSLPSRVIHGARRALSASQFRRATASGALRAGEDLRLGSFARVSAGSTQAPCVTIGDHVFLDATLMTRGAGTITIGSHCWIGGAGATLIGAVESISIGSDVIISTHAHIFDHNSHPTDPGARLRMTRGEHGGALWDWTEAEAAPVVIEDNVWIGEYTMVLKGVTIGRGSVVAAHAVVTKDVPSYSIVAGNPARVVKRLW